MGGYQVFRRALHLFVESSPPGFFCVLAFPSGHDRFVGVQVPGHGYRPVHPSRIGPWVVEQRFAAQFGVRQGREGGISSLGQGSGWVRVRVRVVLKRTRKQSELEVLVLTISRSSLRFLLRWPIDTRADVLRPSIIATYLRERKRPPYFPP